MPLPLSWFDNEIDPLLSPKIKPLLYLYDQYQTYDLIEWSLLTPYWGTNELPFDFLNYKTLGEVSTILIDRFTPWDYEWAEHYSTKIFNFIYEYTGTNYHDVSFVSGMGYDYTSRIRRWDFDSFYDSRSNYISDEVTLNIPATQHEQAIIITWLEYDNLDLNFSPVNRSLKAILVKKYKKIITNQALFNITLNFSSIALCSTVISSSSPSLALNIKQQLNTEKGILYDNLDSVLIGLKSKLEATFPRLFKLIDTMSYHYEIDVRCEGGNNGASFRAALGGDMYDSYIWNEIYPKAIFTYRERPSYYRSACLLYANNNYWNNGNIYNDLGKTPKFFANPLLPEQYQPLFPSHDLLYVEDLGGINLDSTTETKVTVPGNTYPDKPDSAGEEIGIIFVGKPYVYSFPNLLKTTSGEKHYLYKIVSRWDYADTLTIWGASYDVYKFYCILTHEGNMVISSEGGKLEFLGTNNNPADGEIFRYSDSQSIDVLVKYHYFENDNEGILTFPFRVPLSDEETIALIDNYLYQSTEVGEFDNA